MRVCRNGRRGGLKHLWVTPCGFKSHHPHQAKRRSIRCFFSVVKWEFSQCRTWQREFRLVGQGKTVAEEFGRRVGGETSAERNVRSEQDKTFPCVSEIESADEGQGKGWAVEIFCSNPLNPCFPPILSTNGLTGLIFFNFLFFCNSSWLLIRCKWLS